MIAAFSALRCACSTDSTELHSVGMLTANLTHLRSKVPLQPRDRFLYVTGRAESVLGVDACRRLDIVLINEIATVPPRRSYTKSGWKTAPSGAEPRNTLDSRLNRRSQSTTHLRTSPRHATPRSSRRRHVTPAKTPDDASCD